MSKSHFNRHFMKSILLAVLFITIFASLSAAAERRLGAIAATQASHQAQSQAAANLGAGGSPGTDLRAISSASRGQQQPTTFTGFPAGTLPGDSAGGGSSSGGGTTTKVTMTLPGESALAPLSPIIGFEMIGSKLSKICSIVDHVGYTIGRRTYSPTVMDTPYSFALMRGNSRIATLYFNRSMTLIAIQ